MKMRKWTLGLVVVLIVIVGGLVVVPSAFDEWVEKNSRPYFVPLIVTGSLQLVNGQVLLYKMTNVSTAPVHVRLNLFNENQSIPGTYKDFKGIRSMATVSYVYEPPKIKIPLGEATVEAPQPVRAQITPMPGADTGTIRNVVATVQILRIQKAPDGTSSLEQATVVPVEHCNFEPRGYAPISTGHKRTFNCAPMMYPYDMKWLAAGRGDTGPEPNNPELQTSKRDANGLRTPTE
jgi:hypothetical protein